MNSANIQDRSASGTPCIGSAGQYSKFKIGYPGKRTAGYIIENVFEDDVAALASWKSASHIEVPPKKKNTTTNAVIINYGTLIRRRIELNNLTKQPI